MAIPVFLWFLFGASSCQEPKDIVIPDSQPAGGGKTNLTFFVAADTHFGFEGIDKLNRRQIEAMNALPGKPWPKPLGGTVQAPKGVLIAGDLTERGAPEQWRQFVELYGLTGSDGLLKWPVFECSGNHDRDRVFITPVLDGVRKRHGALCYGWNWNGVNLFCLDRYPSDDNRRWLQRQLERVGKTAPVVIYFHYSILGPFSEWWSNKDKKAFAEVLRGHNVLGIFHGHYHGSEHYTWEGFDVYNVGSPRHGEHSFGVVRITPGRMTVAEWAWEVGVPDFRAATARFSHWKPGGWTWWHTKPINGTAGPTSTGWGDRIKTLRRFKQPPSFIPAQKDG